MAVERIPNGMGGSGGSTSITGGNTGTSRIAITLNQPRIAISPTITKPITKDLTKNFNTNTLGLKTNERVLPTLEQLPEKPLIQKLITNEVDTETIDISSKKY